MLKGALTGNLLLTNIRSRPESIHYQNHLSYSKNCDCIQGSVARTSESEVRLVFRHNYPAKAINWVLSQA